MQSDQQKAAESNKNIAQTRKRPLALQIALHSAVRRSACREEWPHEMQRE
jgi:hypothetical protein